MKKLFVLLLLAGCASTKTNSIGLKEYICTGQSETQILKAAASKSIEEECSYFAVIVNNCVSDQCELLYVPLKRKDVEWAKSQGYKIYNAQSCFNLNR